MKRVLVEVEGPYKRAARAAAGYDLLPVELAENKYGYIRQVTYSGPLGGGLKMMALGEREDGGWELLALSAPPLFTREFSKAEMRTEALDFEDAEEAISAIGEALSAVGIGRVGE